MTDPVVDRPFVAQVAGRVVGHVAFTRSRLDAPVALVDVLVLSPLSVVPEQQGRRPSLRIPEAAFQVRALAATDRPLSGTLVYHRAFWDHDAVGLRDQARSPR